MAILLGTIVGGIAAKDGGDPASFARHDDGVRARCAGASSLLIPRTGRGAPDLGRSATSSPRPARCCSICATTARLWWGALVTSWFWLVGAVVLSLLPPLVKNVLGGTEEVVTAFLAIFSICDRDRLGPRRLARAPAASCCCRR